MNRFPMLGAGVAVVVLMVAGSVAAQVVATPQILTSAQEQEVDQPACLLPPHTPTSPPKEIYGAWNTVVPDPGGAAIGEILGMQTVHTVMLPSGKILMISGSTLRRMGRRCSTPTAARSRFWEVSPHLPACSIR